MSKPKRPFHMNVVLVRSLYESNIGASSRAMDNMGFSRLILIGPHCEIGYPAQQAAATGQTALQNRVEYSSWAEFYAQEPDGIRVALTARDGRGRAVRDLTETLLWISQEEPRFQDFSSSDPIEIYLFFGPEDWGLSAEDLELAHFACSIPTYGENSSLNLAQAVLLTLFQVRQNWGGEKTVLDGQIRTRQSEATSVFPEETLRAWLLEMGFDLSKPKINVHSVLKRMLLHNAPTPKELMTLETVLQQSLRKLQEYNEMRKKN